MKKAETMERWRDLEPDQNPLPHMTPIPYKARGSRYGACGIRIDGNPAFIDAVLSRLKSLIDGENHVTRLELSRNAVDGSKLDKHFELSDRGAECCYIRLHVRGNEGSMASAIFDRHLDSATERFAAAGPSSAPDGRTAGKVAIATSWPSRMDRTGLSSGRGVGMARVCSCAVKRPSRWAARDTWPMPRRGCSPARPGGRESVSGLCCERIA